MSPDSTDERPAMPFRYHLELTPAQLKITHTALRSLLDDFGHDEREVHAVINEVLAKLPDEHAIRAIELEREIDAEPASGLTRSRRRRGRPATQPEAASVSLSVAVGLALAVATAFTSVVGFLYKHRGAAASPPVAMSKPIGSTIMLLGSGAYVLGLVIATASWGLHVGALALAPISLVQSVIAGGLVLLTVTADRLFAHEVTRREWIGVALAAAGLAFLAATIGDGAHSAHADYETSRLVPYIAVAGLGGLALAVLAPDGPRRGVLLGASAGLLWAASDTSIKALSGSLGDGVGAVLLTRSPWSSRSPRSPAWSSRRGAFSSAAPCR